MPCSFLMSHCHHSNPEVLHPPRAQATLVFCLGQDFSLILQMKLTRVIDCSKDSHKTSWCGIVTCIATELFSHVLSYSLWYPLVWKNCQHHFMDGKNQSSQLLKSWFLTLRQTKSWVTRPVLFPPSILITGDPEEAETAKEYPPKSPFC